MYILQENAFYWIPITLIKINQALGGEILCMFSYVKPRLYMHTHRYRYENRRVTIWGKMTTSRSVNKE